MRTLDDLSRRLSARTTGALLAAVLAVALGAAGTARSEPHGAFPGTNGRIVFNNAGGELVLVNADGTGLVRIAYTGTADNYIGASFSPDGSQIAYSRADGSDPDVFVIRPDGSSQRQVTFSRGTDVDPTWSGDGSRIAFETSRNGNVDIYAVDDDGSNSTRLTTAPQDELDPSWSPRGDLIAYTVAAGVSRQIWVMSGDGSGKKQLTNAPNFSQNPNWSPDGRRIVFDSDRAEKGDLDVYSMRADGSDVRRLTESPSLDALPAYSPDGRQIVFVSDRLAKDSRKLFVMTAAGGNQRRLISVSGQTYQMLPDWQPVRSKDPCTIRGTIHADRLAGTQKADVICGLGGNDRIDGGGGNDTIGGGGGADALVGGSGNDRLSGDAGADALDGGDGNDVLRGGAGNDRLVGRRGTDTMRGDAGDDTFDAKDGSVDSLDGGAGTDRSFADANDRRTGIEKVLKKRVLAVAGSRGAGCALANGHLELDLTDAVPERMTGTIHGDYAYAFERLLPTGGNPRVSYVEGRSVVTTPTGDLRFTENSAAALGSDGRTNNATLMTVEGGTGAWAGATGFVPLRGYFHNSALSGRFDYRGEICTT